MNYLDRKYDFDDVYLVPRQTYIGSREDISLRVNLNGIILDVPIIVSPMTGIASKELIKEVSDAGGTGILPRFYKYEDKRIEDIIWMFENITNSFGVAIGTSEREREIAIFISDISHRYRIYSNKPNLLKRKNIFLCVDVANGYSDKLHTFLNSLRDKVDIPIMSGNVISPDGVRKLRDSNCNIVRVGIGSGKLCLTRNNTGVGYPQISAIDECSSSGVEDIVSDGGIRCGGDIVKALAVGAKAVMIGSLFGEAVEADHDGIIYGMASKEHQTKFYGKTKSNEGTFNKVDKHKTAKEIVEELAKNIRSGMMYCDSTDIKELQRKYLFVLR